MVIGSAHNACIHHETFLVENGFEDDGSLNIRFPQRRWVVERLQVVNVVQTLNDLLPFVAKGTARAPAIRSMDKGRACGCWSCFILSVSVLAGVTVC